MPSTINWSFEGLVIETTENVYRYHDVVIPGATCNWDTPVDDMGSPGLNYSHYSVLLDDYPGPMVEQCGADAVTAVQDERYGQSGFLCSRHAIMSIGDMQNPEDGYETITKVTGEIHINTQ